MPSILLDHRIEAAMRATTYPDRRHRWSRRHTTITATSAAKITATAVQQLRAAAGSALPDATDEPIDFSDVWRQPDPEWSRPAADAARRQAYAAADADYAELTPSALSVAAELHTLRMALAPIIAQIVDAPPPIDWLDVLRGVEARTVRDLVHLTDWANSAVGLSDYRFALSLRFDSLDEPQDELADELCEASGIHQDEAADMELLAIEAGLPLRAETAVSA